MASWLAPGHPAWRGASSQSCVWQFGLEPKVGGLTVEKAQPIPTTWGFQPQAAWTFHSLNRNPGQAVPLVPPPLHMVYSRPYIVGKGWSHHSIEHMGKLGLREGM